MTNMIRCHNCGGQGKVQGIGWMEVECAVCFGKCKIEKPTSSFEPGVMGASVSCGTSDSTKDGKCVDVKQVVASAKSSKAVDVSNRAKRA